jgi:hypothetical protein
MDILRTSVLYSHLKVSAALRPTCTPGSPPQVPRPSMVPVSFSLDQFRPVGTSTGAHIPDTRMAGFAPSIRSKLLILQLPCLHVVYQEANVDDLARDACSVGYVRPHSGKLELLVILVKRNIKET